MKKRYINILLAGLLSTGMFSSCSDEFLDQEPYTAINASEALLTDNDVLTALFATYSGLQSVDLYGRTIPLVGDLLADNTFVSTYNAGRYLEFEGYFFTKNTGSVSGLWTDAYEVISRTNNIINSEQTTIDDQSNIDQYKGEAHAIRALMYFELLRHYAKPFTTAPDDLGVPIVLAVDKDAEPKRNTTRQVYEQINSDLDKAFQMMTKKYGASRFSKYAAKALQAKIKLHMGNYEEALENAEDVIDNSGIGLVGYTDYLSYWQDPKPASIESLFEVVSTETDNLGTNELGYIYNQSGYGDILTSKAVYDLYPLRDELKPNLTIVKSASDLKDVNIDSSDVRKFLIIKGSRNRGENPAYIINKYPNVSGDRDDKKVLRMSEMYLIAAEAAYRLNDEETARGYLNALVTERDPFLEYTATGDDLLAAIILERRKELAFEGDRIHTLDRLGRDVVGRPDSPFDVPFSDFRRIFPIPQSEMTANENIEQNPQW